MRITLGVAFLGLVGLAACGSGSTGFGDRGDLVSAPSACAPKRFEVYFDENQATLTNAARQAVSMTATQLQGCHIGKVQVIGLADAVGGTAASNLTLSERRARAVAEALEAAGWPAPVFDVTAAGADGASTAGINEPLRRRTEVLIEAGPGR